MFARVRLVAACLALAAGASRAHAVAPDGRAPSARAVDDGGLVALPAAGVARPPRAHVELAAVVPAARAAGWQRLRAAAPGLDRATFDVATGVPSRIWGRGVDVPGSVADGAVALAAARRFLADHVDLLAPGARADDFALAANDLDGELRTIGFVQRHRGLPVIGGQVSFRFKRDRLFVIGSEALPDVAIAGDVRFVDLARSAAILPLVGDRGVLGYRLVVPVDVDGGAAGSWRIYTDPVSGAPLARQATTRFAAGTVAFDAVVRWAGRPRQVAVAPRLAIAMPAGSARTTAAGVVTWPGEAPVSVTLGVDGELVDVTNRAGDDATVTMTVAPGGTAVWRPGDDRDLDAQLSAFIHAGVVKEYARRFAPALGFLDEQLAVRVNIDDECNAYSDGTTINFFRASDRCENTGTIADVVYHEFGHALHVHAIIEGAGFFDGAFSEGLSDYLAATITGDPGMGRGFFKDDTPLRELDPVDGEAMYPRDLGEVHTSGLIFAGAMWDLRKALVDAHGAAEGIPLADRLFYAAVRRAPSIPTTLIEVLAADDDDGDLANGTPNECAIRAAFARHGMRTAGGVITAAGAVAGTTSETTFRPRLELIGLDARCGDQVTSVELEWQPRGSGDSPVAGAAPAALDGDRYVAAMPLPDDGDVARYHFRVGFADGSTLTVPDNRADPWFELYRGDVMPLYCADFEDDPFADGWRAGGTLGVWQWGAPGGSRGLGDPAAASSGTHALGTGLARTAGGYPARASTWIEAPTVDVGRWSDVRLHYRRWLNVEDGFFDQASVKVNGEVAWTNFASASDGDRTTHHEDRAWVFHDVPLSRHLRGHQATVRWQLDSDEGLELGGWTLDDVCVVANVRSVCGDGALTGAEQCDLGDGNQDVADTCRTTCRLPVCGDGIADADEACDDGNTDNLDGCTQRCEPYDPFADPGGCCSTGGSARTVWLAPLVLGLLIRRRRRR